MDTPSKDLMIKVARTPGLCSSEEIESVFSWLQQFNQQLILYKSVWGEPAGLSVDSLMDNLAYYRK